MKQRLEQTSPRQTDLVSRLGLRPFVEQHGSYFIVPTRASAVERSDFVLINQDVCKTVISGSSGVLTLLLTFTPAPLASSNSAVALCPSRQARERAVSLPYSQLTEELG